MCQISKDEIKVIYSNRKNLSVTAWGALAMGLLIYADYIEIIESYFLLATFSMLSCFVIYAKIDFYRKLYAGEPALIFNDLGLTLPSKSNNAIKWVEVNEAKIVSKRNYEFVLVGLKNEQEYIKKAGFGARFNKFFYDVHIVLSDSHIEISNKEILDNILKYIEKHGSQN